MIYFVQSGADGPIKIGYVEGEDIAAVHKRMALMQVGNWCELKLRAVMPGGLTVEQRLHKIFAAGSIRGEWFEADTPDLAESIAYLNEQSQITAWQVRDDGEQLCEWCKTGVVRPPRRTLCSPACLKESRRAAARARARRSEQPISESGDLQGEGLPRGADRNRTGAAFRAGFRGVS